MFEENSRAFIARIGRILSNITVFFTVLIVLLVLGVVATPILMVVLVLLWIIGFFFTLGLAALDESYVTFPERVMDKISVPYSTIEKIYDGVNILAVVLIVINILSIIFLRLDPTPKRHIERRIVSIISIVVVSLYLIAVTTGLIKIG